MTSAPNPHQPPQSDEFAAPPPTLSETEARAAEIEKNEVHNLLWLEVHQVFYRIAWIFKTESVIIPAFVDAMGDGQAWLRGWLPVLNRVGQSVPPMLYASNLRDMPQKKYALFGSTLAMAGPMLALGGAWLIWGATPWLAPLFFLLYFLFFATTGINQLASGTVLGKLIRAEHRGGLLAVSGTFGTIGASTLAWFLLQYWLSLDPRQGFGYIFLFTGAGFVVAGLLCLPLIEPADEAGQSNPSFFDRLTAAWRLAHEDHHFRRIAIISMLFITGQFIFPHYQWLGRQQMGDANQGFNLMLWIVVQNLGVGVFSFVFGHMADRFGNRLVLRIIVVTMTLTPVSALLFTSGWLGPPENVYWITFVLLGMMPVGLRTLVNYTLELNQPEFHPLYVGALSLFQAVPLVFSPLIGLVMDYFGFPAVFGGVAATVALGGLLTIDMIEPRQFNELKQPGGIVTDTLTDKEETL